MAKQRRLRIPTKMREMADIDYLDQLNEEERNFMFDFIDAEYCNNVAKHDMYKQLPNYEEVKKEIYTRTNAVNTRCDYTKAKVQGNLESFDAYSDEKTRGLLEDMMSKAVESIRTRDITKELGFKKIEDMVEELIDSTIAELSSELKDSKVVLARFYLNMKKMLRDDRKMKREDSPKRNKPTK